MSSMIKTGFCLAAVLGSAFLASASDLEDQVNALANPLIEDDVVVGMVVGIVQQDEVTILSYGETRKGSEEKPTGDSVYEIGSVTKAFTGILLADAVRQGKVKLDDPLNKYLPEGVAAPTFEDEAITLGHLASHTSGLPRMPGNFRPADPTRPYVDYDRKKMNAFLSDVKLRRGPGTYEYSNYATGLLGEVVAEQWGKRYEEALEDRVFKPLDLKDTRISLNDAMGKRMTPGYTAAGDEVPVWDFDAFAGAGAIRSTVNDMVKFIQANLSEDDSDIALALRDARVKQPLPKTGQPMALGWHIARDGITWWHNGMTGGYHSWLAVVPEHNVGVVALSNTATMKVTAFGENVTRLALGESVKPPKDRKEVELDAETLDKYAGVYELTPQFALTVRVKDGKLFVQATGQPELEVFAESPTKFFYTVVDAQITFVVDDDGKIEKLILHQLGRNLEASRK